MGSQLLINSPLVRGCRLCGGTLVSLSDNVQDDSEMKRFLEDLGYGAAGVGLLAGAVCWLCYGEFDFRQILMLVVGATLLAACVFMIRQDAQNGCLFSKTRKKIKQQWCRAARSAQDLPFALLADNFRRLAAVDDMTVAETDYLSWKEDSRGEIRINKITDTDWICLFWVRGDAHMTDARLRKICLAESVELPASFLKMKAHGLAVYRDGQLSVFPAPHFEDFQDAFLDTVLQLGEAFSAWLEDLADDAE